MDWKVTMNRSTLSQREGFTLVELLVAMIISLIGMSAIYAIFMAQQKSHASQQQVVGAQQNVRASLFYLTRAIRMAGYNPARTAGAGFVSNFPTPNDGYGATTSANHIAFTVDANGNGAIDDDIDELIAFRLDSNKLEVFRKGTDNWQTIAEDVAALNFTYLDTDGASTSVLDDIRAVRIRLVVTTDQGRTRQLTQKVYCRNLYFG
jgi:prepilin-type N-terminal cleavage/methylation domain-containing protein